MNKTMVLLAGIGGYGAGYLNEMLDAKEPSFILAGVADPFASGSSRFDELNKRGIKIYKTPKDFFADGGRAELTVIASPIHTHYPYIIDCFENNSSVLCEKPITGNISRLDDLIAREEKSGLFCAVGFQACFAGDTLELKKDIMAGVYGKPVSFKAIHMTRRGDKYYRRNNWAGRLTVEGETILDSPLNNGCSHDLQIMLFLLGEKMNSSAEISSVKAELWQGRQDIENFDAAALGIKTSGNVTGYFYTAHCVDTFGNGPIGEMVFEKAKILRNEKPFSGLCAYSLQDNKLIKSYSEFGKEPELKKLYDSLESTGTGVPPIVTLKTVRSHLNCVDYAAKTPVRKVPAEKLASGVNTMNENEKDPFYYIPGLKEAFLRCYAENALPSEIDFEI